VYYLVDIIKPKILHAGDSCIVAEFGSTISLEINSNVQEFRKKLESTSIPGITELVPTYRSLAIYFDPTAVDPGSFIEKISSLSSDITSGSIPDSKVAIVPVCYGGDLGPDMETVASHNGLTMEEVIERHCKPDYYCYMLGFTPGFSYLGGMDETIATPRLDNPRTLIQAGSVGIAGKQTGIYSIDSPGGWQLIGRTPLRLFDPSVEPPTLLDAGLWVRFKPITIEEFRKIETQVSQGSYKPVFLDKAGGAI
jgi:KipI family sensor histidine kinase inhibitor